MEGRLASALCIASIALLAAADTKVGGLRFCCPLSLHDAPLLLLLPDTSRQELREPLRRQEQHDNGRFMLLRHLLPDKVPCRPSSPPHRHFSTPRTT